MAELDSIAEKCNYANYIEEHVTFPPKGVLPLQGEASKRTAAATSGT